LTPSKLFDLIETGLAALPQKAVQTAIRPAPGGRNAHLLENTLAMAMRARRVCLFLKTVFQPADRQGLP
jgi:hypothetical protein